MIKWLIENDKIEWYIPHFYEWRSDRMLENHFHEQVSVWTKNANEAWHFDTEKDANDLILILKKSVKFFDLTLKATEHEFI